MPLVILIVGSNISTLLCITSYAFYYRIRYDNKNHDCITRITKVLQLYIHQTLQLNNSVVL